MNMKMKMMVSVMLAGLSVGAIAAEADKLGTELSPVGAEKGANSDGSIPALGAKDAPQPGWSFGKNRQEFWSHNAEKPLFSIDASNVDKYADKLSPSQVALVKQTKGYRMDVYPTHRSCGYPDFAQANTKANVTRAKIASDGWSLEDAVLPGVPFPMPKKGIEVIWNYLNLYNGVGAEWPNGLTYISPRPGSTEPIVVGWDQFYYWPWAKKGATNLADLNGVREHYFYQYHYPAAFAGQGTVGNFFFKQDTEVFYYFTGQRRVRRMPAYSYDSPVIGYENQYPVDAINLYGGNPDRFDWKLLGKKEMYIPYNDFKFNDGSVKVADAFQEHAVNPALGRYELHRVWVVEGTVKQGVRHNAPKKVMYFDEDSWIAAVGHHNDEQGKIWKMKQNQSIQSRELGV